MRKLLVMAAMLLTAATGFAQEEAEKPYVYVSLFENATNVSGYRAYIDKMRSEVIAGLMNTQRVEVLDATTQNLSANKNEKLAELYEKGCNYVLEGKLNSIATGMAYDKKNRSANVGYTLTVIDTETKLTKASKNFSETGIGENDGAAIQSAVSDVHKRMRKFVDDHFKVAAVIKAIDLVDEKKGVVKTCYITMGSALGIQKGQIFEVFAETEVAGEMISKKIGELKAKEVLSTKLTLCDVKNGGDQIKKFSDSKTTMTVQTRATKDVFGLRNLIAN